MRRPDFVSGLVPRVAALVSILALAGCGSGGGGTKQDSGTGGQTGAGGHIGSGGSGSGGSGSGGSASGGAGGAAIDAGTGGMTGAGGAAGMSGAGGGTGGQMDAGMDTLTGAGGSGMGGAGGDLDAGVDVPADSGAGGGGGDVDAGADAADASPDAGTLATGVEMVSVPLTATGTGQRYNAQNRSNPDVPYNLSGQTLTIRAYAPGAIGGDMSVFFQSSIPVDGAATGAVDSMATRVALSTLAGGFTDVQITVPAAAGGFDPSMVDDIRVEIEADATFGGTFRSPATLVFFDSITSGNGAVNLTFDVAAGATFASSGARSLAGSTGPTFQATFP